LKILFTHINYPAQFRRLIPFLISHGHEVAFVSQNKEWNCPDLPNVLNLKAEPHRASAQAYLHPYLRQFEKAILLGQAVFRSLAQLDRLSWQPDVVISHVGYGNGLFLRDRFPNALKVSFLEWFYNPHGSDADFLTNGFIDTDQALKLRVWNSQVLSELVDSDICVTPTRWQRNQFPAKLRSHINVIHEGIDFENLSLINRQNIRRPECLNDAASDVEVLTYVTRCFEEYRGFPQALRAIELLQKERPKLHVLIVGHDSIAYGSPRSDGLTWKQWALQNLQLDEKRTHWMGLLDEECYRQVLAHSDVHLYLTVPFVLSWSLLESMAVGCSLVCSETPPVEEVLENNKNALLINFFDVAAIVSSVTQMLDNPGLRSTLAVEAQSTASNYAASNGCKQWLTLIEQGCQGLLTGTTALD